MSFVQRLYRIAELPALPEVVLEIQQLIGSNTADARKVAHIIEQDVSLAAKVLKVANSAYYGPVQRTSSVQLAIAQIGFNEVCNIVTTVSLISQFPAKSTVLNYRQFWRHSLSSAYLAQNIGAMSESRFSVEERQFLFLAGLLHDVGILVYDQFFHPEFKSMVDEAIRNGQTFLESEQAHAGKQSHPWVGSALLELWKLAIPIISGVRFHHEPDKAPEKLKHLASAVFLAEYVLCSFRPDVFEGRIEEIPADVWEKAGLLPDSLPLLYENAEQQVARSDTILASD
jgi:HD-like signal output (HDOD) protein